MKPESNFSFQPACAHAGCEGAAEGSLAVGGWQAGARYSGGTEIWYADSDRKPAWTTDRHGAAVFLNQAEAFHAARLICDGSDAQPFLRELTAGDC